MVQYPLAANGVGACMGIVESSDAPIVRSVIGIGPIMRFLGSIGIGKFY